MIGRRSFLRGALAAGFGVPALSGLYAWQVEPHWLELVERPLPIPHLPDALDRLTVAQLSDLHIGRVDPGYVRSVFRRVADRKPDLVVITGDFISVGEPEAIRALRLLLEDLPRGRLGTFGILGNHDYGEGWHQLDVANRVSSAAAEAGVRMLRNEVTEVEGLQVAGLDDLWSGRFSTEVLGTLDAERPMLALCHNPDGVDRPGWDGFQGWILAGHTHGGQCRPPFLPPPILPVRNRRYAAGEIVVDPSRRLYVNRGVGHLLKVRFNCRPEATIFRLSRALILPGPDPSLVPTIGPIGA
ncbi:MAG: metallophosphoesterase [Gemmatimonadales bacterium]